MEIGKEGQEERHSLNDMWRANRVEAFEGGRGAEGNLEIYEEEVLG